MKSEHKTHFLRHDSLMKPLIKGLLTLSRGNIPDFFVLSYNITVDDSLIYRD